VLTSGILFHLASGQAFFSGAACLLVAIAAPPQVRKRPGRVTRNILVGLGSVLIALSATPLPLLLYALLGVAMVAWSVCEARRSSIPVILVAISRAAAASACVAAVLVELPHHRNPRLPPLGRPVLGVVGDSVSAGLGESRGKTWPSLLARRHRVDVRDHSAMGATVASALRQVEAVTPEERLVLLEIGGNDLLGGTSPEAFEAGLARLLHAATQPGRTVVMLELPLPPGYNQFGRIQRRLARRYGVRLVPKRVVLGVLLHDGATVDSIHLSPGGHALMAESVWAVLREAFETTRSGDPDLR